MKIQDAPVSARVKTMARILNLETVKEVKWYLKTINKPRLTLHVNMFTPSVYINVEKALKELEEVS
jgi:hypothetical protein